MCFFFNDTATTEIYTSIDTLSLHDALPISPWYPVAVAASFLRGACIGFGVAVWETMLMELVPQHMLSRVISLDWFGSFGLTPVGLLLVGAVAGLAAPGTIIALGACISICIVAGGLFSRQIRTID